MATTNIYLNFNGNCEDAFTLYKSVFGGDFTYLGRFGEMPETEDFIVEEIDKEKIMHISLPIGSTTLMGSDNANSQSDKFVRGNNFSISITAETKAEADSIFNGLAQDGQVAMPMEDTFWGDYFGMLTDQFGINWMVSFNDGKS